VRWTVDNATQTNNITAYRINYWSTGFNQMQLFDELTGEVPTSDGGRIVIDDANVREAIVSGLHVYTEYAITVEARNAKGDGPASTIQTQTTAEEGGSI
jgi:hypothetical protein